MNDEFQEALKCVDELNYEYYDLIEDGETVPFSLEHFTYQTVIKFNDVVVWDSDNDERYWNETDDIGGGFYEPIKSYVINQVMEIGKKQIKYFMEFNNVTRDN